MSVPSIEIRACDDWIAVYKDGVKVWNNHSCPITDGLEALGIPFEQQYFEAEQMNEWGDRLADGTDPFPEVLP